MSMRCTLSSMHCAGVPWYNGVNTNPPVCVFNTDVLTPTQRMSDWAKCGHAAEPLAACKGTMTSGSFYSPYTITSMHQCLLFFSINRLLAVDSMRSPPRREWGSNMRSAIGSITKKWRERFTLWWSKMTHYHQCDVCKCHSYAITHTWFKMEIQHKTLYNTVKYIKPIFLTHWLLIGFKKSMYL